MNDREKMLLNPQLFVNAEVPVVSMKACLTKEFCIN